MRPLMVARNPAALWLNFSTPNHDKMSSWDLPSLQDNEAAPENSTLDWLNLNALGSRAIQGAIDRMRASTLGAGEAEAIAEKRG